MGKKFRGGGRASLFSLYIESEDGSGGGGELKRHWELTSKGCDGSMGRI